MKVIKLCAALAAVSTLAGCFGEEQGFESPQWYKINIGNATSDMVHKEQFTVGG